MRSCVRTASKTASSTATELGERKYALADDVRAHNLRMVGHQIQSAKLARHIVVSTGHVADSREDHRKVPTKCCLCAKGFTSLIAMTCLGLLAC